MAENNELRRSIGLVVGVSEREGAGKTEREAGGRGERKGLGVCVRKEGRRVNEEGKRIKEGGMRGGKDGREVYR